MSRIESLSRKIAVLLIYLLMFLGFFQVKEIFLNPTPQNFKQLFFCLILSIVVSYMNGFSFLKKNNYVKKK